MPKIVIDTKKVEMTGTGFKNDKYFFRIHFVNGLTIEQHNFTTHERAGQGLIDFMKQNRIRR